MKVLIIIAGILCLCPFPVSAYVCGDADSDQDVNIADCIFILNYVFRGGPAPEPFEAGDVNVDLQINVGDAAFLVGYIFKGGPQPCPDPIGQVAGFDGCKTAQHSGASLFLECVEYEYRQGTLYLTHLNGEFNCCIESIQAAISVEETSITIYEIEYFGEGTPCYCICPFDIDFEIAFLPTGQYTIYIDMLGSTPSPIEFTVDLEEQPSGIYCVE